VLGDSLIVPSSSMLTMRQRHGLPVGQVDEDVVARPAARLWLVHTTRVPAVTRRAREGLGLLS
jgi:hypothetical protein